VGRILNNADADIIAGSTAVPGAFTREAWDNYLRNAIVEASKGELKGDDWVLAVAISEFATKDDAADRNRSELEALYRAEYAQEWKNFLQGLAVHEMGDLAKAATALGRMGDAANSPVKRILQRAAFETAWDNPTELSKKNRVGKNQCGCQGRTAYPQQLPDSAGPAVGAKQYGGSRRAVCLVIQLAGAPNARAPWIPTWISGQDQDQAGDDCGHPPSPEQMRGNSCRPPWRALIPNFRKHCITSTMCC